MNERSILLVGGVEFSRSMLDALLSVKAPVTSIITIANPKPNTDQRSLVDIAESKQISYLKTDNINSPEVLEWVKEKSPSICFCVGWSQLLRQEFLSLIPEGVIGYHPTLLPQNRGRHPIIWALVLGLEKTGSTFFFIDEKADTGNIISQEVVPILYEDNSSSLYKKITATASNQIVTIAEKILLGTLTSIEQENTHSNTWRKRGYSDGQIDFRMSSRSIYNLVRALTRPYPGAFVRIKDKDYSVWAVSEISDIGCNNDEPGKVLGLDNGSLVIKCGEGAVALLETDLQSEGVRNYCL
jgi:methionyl-tRNA formyltransferase